MVMVTDRARATDVGGGKTKVEGRGQPFAAGTAVFTLIFGQLGNMFDMTGEISAQLACSTYSACVGNDVLGAKIGPMDLPYVFRLPWSEPSQQGVLQILLCHPVS